MKIFGYVVLEALPIWSACSNNEWYTMGNYRKKNNAGWIIDKNLTELENKIKEIHSLSKNEFEKKICCSN